MLQIVFYFLHSQVSIRTHFPRHKQNIMINSEKRESVWHMKFIIILLVGFTIRTQCLLFTGSLSVVVAWYCEANGIFSFSFAC